MPKYNLNFCRYKLILVTIIVFSTLNKVNTLHKISPEDFSSVNVTRSKRDWLGLIVNSWLRIICKKKHLQWVPKVFTEHLQWILPKKRIALWIPRAAKHSVKSVLIRSFSGPYFPAFGLDTGICSPYLFLLSPNAGKYGPEKFQIQTLFTHWKIAQKLVWLKNNTSCFLRQPRRPQWQIVMFLCIFQSQLG